MLLIYSGLGNGRKDKGVFMEYLMILVGILSIIFRKRITSFNNRIRLGIPKRIKEKADKDMVEKTTKNVVTIQEIFTAIVGAIFVIMGILIKLGLVHMKP